jgi:hypothetical protein
VEEGEADCVGFQSNQMGGRLGADRCSSSTITKDAQGNEHMMIQFNVSDAAGIH